MPARDDAPMLARMALVIGSTVGLLAACSDGGRETVRGADGTTPPPGPEPVSVREVPMFEGRPFMTLDGETVLVGGGGPPEGFEPDVWRVDLASVTATRLPDLPDHASVHALVGAVVDGRTIVVAQGCAPMSDEQPPSSSGLLCDGMRGPVAWVDDGTGDGWRPVAVPDDLLDGTGFHDAYDNGEYVIGVGVRQGQVLVAVITDRRSLRIVSVDPVARRMSVVADLRAPFPYPRVPQLCVAADGTLLGLELLSTGADDHVPPPIVGEVRVSRLADDGTWEPVHAVDLPEPTEPAAFASCEDPARPQLLVTSEAPSLGGLGLVSAGSPVPRRLAPPGTRTDVGALAVQLAPMVVVSSFEDGTRLLRYDDAASTTVVQVLPDEAGNRLFGQAIAAGDDVLVATVADGIVPVPLT